MLNECKRRGGFFLIREEKRAAPNVPHLRLQLIKSGVHCPPAADYPGYHWLADRFKAGISIQHYLLAPLVWCSLGGLDFGFRTKAGLL